MVRDGKWTFLLQCVIYVRLCFSLRQEVQDELTRCYMHFYVLLLDVCHYPCESVFTVVYPFILSASCIFNASLLYGSDTPIYLFTYLLYILHFILYYMYIYYLLLIILIYYLTIYLNQIYLPLLLNIMNLY